MKKFMVWMLSAVLVTQIIIPAMAEVTGYRASASVTELRKAEAQKASLSDAEEPEATPSDATPSDADQNKDIFFDMPEIGSREFTEWFFGNKDREELWDWVTALLETKTGAEYNAFLPWYTAHKKEVEEAYHQFLGIATLESSTGDLWNGWNGDMDFSGEGTKDTPYQIDTLSHLMGLSEAVASGTSYEGKYFELTQSIDLGAIEINNGNWNPIGWYQNASELSGAVSHPFKGNFDGGGNTISGLKIISTTQNLQNVGLFGSVAGGSIKKLIVEADTVRGFDNTAILAGSVSGSTVIYEVTVSGTVTSKGSSGGDVGGIAGEITGGTKNATIENCTAKSIVVNSESAAGFIGGIAGNVQKADLVDNKVITQNGDSDRIQGKGYVGGIAGRMNLANIYNSYVSGTIGGNGSKAAGGIVGKYESGNLIIARFAGEISKTNTGTAVHEGTFVGTREGRHKFTYGTGKEDNLSYLFTTDAEMAKNVFGSNIDKDNTFKNTAHIGYWADNETKFTLVAGTTQTVQKPYFYEELEAGVKHIVIQKLGNDFTAGGYGEDLAFKIDHFAPGDYGQPVRGYLVSVPVINAKNAGGTYDTDVATLTADPTGNNTFYRTIDKDNPAAVTPGTTVTVATAAKNSGGNRYQMVFDEGEAGKAKPPTYIDDLGGQTAMGYMSGGTYSFEMPLCDTEINVEYVKVTTKLTMTPEETTISIIHTRNGDRKAPTVTTEIKDETGKLIAKYIDGEKEMEVQPIIVHAEHNDTGNTADKKVLWSVDDADLLINTSDPGYVLTDARVITNPQSTFIQGIITREVKAQADGGYTNKINNTIYKKSAVVTAATNPATSSDNQVVYGNTKVNVTFQIVDHTTLRVEGLVLNKSEAAYTVTRKLTGDRLNPIETITCSAPTILSATLTPSQPFYKNVSWSDQENEKIVSLTPQGDNTRDCTVSVQYDPAGTDNPAWIQNVINEDNTKKAADNGYLKLSGSARQKEIITAVSEDQTHGNIKAKCNVTVNFVTIDETVIHPKSVVLDQNTASYDLVYTKTGNMESETISVEGFDTKKLTATVHPDITDEDGHKPYDRAVIWTSGDRSVLTVDSSGNIQPVKDAVWIKEAMSKAPYTAQKQVTITATAKDNGEKADCVVTLGFKTQCIELDQDSLTFDLVLTKTGNRYAPVLTWSGQEPQKVTADIYGTEHKTPVYATGDSEKLTIFKDGTVTPNMEAEWIKKTIETYPYTAKGEVIISAASGDGTMTDTAKAVITVTVIDKTYSTGGSGSSGGGGGGGGGSTGITPSGSKKATSAPAGSVAGTWVQTADGRWTFTAGGRTYVNEWAYIHNPYATTGQKTADWFRFSETGHMICGWFTDAEGNTYYMYPISDNTLGRMVTGWNWIDGKCYYFNSVSDGRQGTLLRNSVTPDGSFVDADGVWIIKGKEQTQK